MALKVNLRHVQEHGLALKGELPAAELDLGVQDEMMAVRRPLQYDLEVEKVAEGLLVQGRLELTLDCECVRCLKPFEKRITLPQWTLHLPLEGEEKAPIDNDCVDLTPFAREDMLLEFPQHPLCEPDCAGLSKKRRGDVKKSPPAWNELDKLNL